jgi:hypothetical protein
MAERRLLQLDAMDMLDQLNAVLERYRARTGLAAQSWQTLIEQERLPGIPHDPAGVPFVLDPTTGSAQLAAESPMAPLPAEPGRPGAVDPSGRQP